MRNVLYILAAAVMAASAAGCVERQMTLVTDPSGAKAYYNGTYVGETPVTFHFTYYQAPELKFEKDGFETLRAIPDVKPPVYQLFPLDFFAEAGPWTLRDRRAYSFVLKEAVQPDRDALISRAEAMRDEMAGK